VSGILCIGRRAAGTGQVEALFLDTLADEARFFSHRRRTLAGGGVIGHQMSIITV
jgi:copper oxidase (laccase) domain-containing protein